MLVTMFGTSTTYAYWGFSLLGHIMDVLYGDHHRIHCLNLAELRDRWQSRESKSVLITTDRPEVNLTKLLTSSGFPCLAFVDEPDDAIGETAGVHNMPVRDAIRFSTGYFCCLGEAFPSDKVRMFGNSYYHSPVRVLVKDVLKAIVGEAEEGAITRVLERLAPDFACRSEATVHELMIRHLGASLWTARVSKEVSDADKGLIEAIARAYRPIFERREVSLVEWPREMFYTANKGNNRPEDIMLVGPARCLIWGPYLCLPVGSWRAHVEFEVVENLSGNEIEADVCASSCLVSVGRALLPALGKFGFYLDFVVSDPNSQIEVRIHLLKGAIEGKLGLLGISLERIRPCDQDKIEIIDAEVNVIITEVHVAESM